MSDGAFDIYSYFFSKNQKYNFVLNVNHNTLFIGKVKHHFDTLPSTNTYASSLLSKNKPSEGTVISTFNQTQGRGQYGSKWESFANQNLTQTFILYPTFILPREQFLLSKAIALGVRDFIAHFIPKSVHIKWPNDILVDGKKIAGILIQNSLSGSSINHSIAGIGININQTDFQFESGRRPTSFCIETQRTYNLTEIQQALFWYIEIRYLQLKTKQWIILHQEYLTNLYQYRKNQRFEKPDGTQFQGVITGINEKGQLMVNCDGHEIAFGLKEIKFL